ncbi:hypothetical protein [Halalkalicoccus ordinarius]
MSDAGVTAPSLDPDESGGVRPRVGRRVGLEAVTDRRSVAVVLSEGR